MPAPKLTAPDRLAIARASVRAVESASANPKAITGAQRFAHARVTAMRDLKAHTGLSADAAAALDPLLTEAAELAGDLVGKGADAAVVAAASAIERDAKCKCDPRFVALLRGLVEVGIESALAGIRRGLQQSF